MSHQLIDKMFRPLFDNDLLEEGHDGAVLDLPAVVEIRIRIPGINCCNYMSKLAIYPIPS